MRRRGAVFNLVALGSAMLLGAGAAPAAAQTGSGGRHVVLYDIPDGQMSWGATSWTGRSTTARVSELGALAAGERVVLLERLRARGGDAVYVEITGETPEVIRLVARPRATVNVRIAEAVDQGHVRGSVDVRRPAAGVVPVIYVRNNVQGEFVIETPAWLDHVTLVVNGRVLMDTQPVERHD